MANANRRPALRLLLIATAALILYLSLIHIFAVSALEMALKFVGMEVRMGAGVAAVQARIGRSV